MTKMREEINEIPEAAARLLEGLSASLGDIGDQLRARDPSFVLTVARGSSDHAAAFIKYAIEVRAGLAVASVGPSIASIYGAQLSVHSDCALTAQSLQSLHSCYNVIATALSLYSQQTISKCYVEQRTPTLFPTSFPSRTPSLFPTAFPSFPTQFPSRFPTFFGQQAQFTPSPTRVCAA